MLCTCDYISSPGPTGPGGNKKNAAVPSLFLLSSYSHRAMNWNELSFAADHTELGEEGKVEGAHNL